MANGCVISTPIFSQSRNSSTQSPNLEYCEVVISAIAVFVLGYEKYFRNTLLTLMRKRVSNEFENELKTRCSKTMNTAEYIKDKLDAKVIETSLVPQKNGSDIVMERCEIDGKYRVVLVYDSDEVTDEKAVIIC